MCFMSSKRIFWMLKLTERLCVLINDSENVRELKKCIEELKIISDVKSCS